MKPASLRRLAALFLAAFAVGAWWVRFSRERGTASPTPAGARRAVESATAQPRPAAPAPPAVQPAVPQPPTPAAARAADPARAAELRAQADALLKDAKILEAIDAFEKALEADPSSARNHGDYGRLLRDLTAIDKALLHLRHAADLDPGSADRWIELANAYYLKTDPGKAWEAEKRARAAEPGLRLRRSPRGLLERADDKAAAGE
ncbi:MAG: hypothetical protein HY899_12000 [Deltaproteobacteria bacterium]|nr:hypothetical protein [Deltaproteobacteria bacterium]